MNITIYGKDNCSYCTKAKSLVDRLVQSGFVDGYEYIDIQKENLNRDDLSKIAGQEIRTVPVILLDGHFIGGFEQLYSRFKDF